MYDRQAFAPPFGVTRAGKFVDKFKVGWTAIVEADEGHLLGGRMVEDGPVFDRFFDALSYMNVVIAAEAVLSLDPSVLTCRQRNGG